MYKDFILVSINSGEKWSLSRGGDCDGSLIEGRFSWGSCHVEGNCLSVCLFDCRLVYLRLGRKSDHILTDQVGGGEGGWGSGEVWQR